MDVIACHQAGFKGAVAPLGTALTEEQISLLWKMIPHDEKEPVLCFDGDEAGYRAAYRATERILPLLKPQQSVRIAFLPEGEDPDTYIREKGTSAFEVLINQARSLVDFLWAHHTAGKKFDTPESRAGLSAKMDALVTQIPDGQLQYHYKQMFRDKLRVLFGNSWKDGKPSKSKSNLQVALPVPSKQKAEILIPQIMLLTILNHPEIYAFVADEFQKLELGDIELERIYHLIIDVLENNLAEEEEPLDSVGLITKLQERGVGEIVSGLLIQERLYVHAGFARAGQSQENVVEGWKSLWSQHNRQLMLADVMTARLALAQNMTPENEARMMALKQAVDELG
jgi:DNA primase